LARIFPSPPGASILQFSNSDDAEIEVLPVHNPDGSVVIMLSNHAVNAPADNNGPGTLRNIAIDVSALGSFQSGNLMIIDANTSVIAGPLQLQSRPAHQCQ
jgi:hypothetical protein